MAVPEEGMVENHTAIYAHGGFCSSHESFSYEVFHHPLLLPICILNESNELWIFPVEHKSSCIPFWKTSRFQTLQIKAPCSFMLGIQAMENSLDCWTNHCTSDSFKLLILSFCSVEVEMEVQPRNCGIQQTAVRFLWGPIWRGKVQIKIIFFKMGVWQNFKRDLSFYLGFSAVSPAPGGALSQINHVWSDVAWGWEMDKVSHLAWGIFSSFCQ